MTQLDWSVDKDAKTITVSGKLSLWRGKLVDKITAETIQRIKDGIEKSWSGQKFKCYTLIVKVAINVVENTSAVRPDAVGVEIAHKQRDFVRSVPGRGVGVHSSTDPNVWKQGYTDTSLDSTDPIFGPMPDADVNQWGGFDSPGTYAHEWGHVMGLSDAYHDILNEKGEAIDFKKVPGAPDDIMSDPKKPILPETITRLIRRNSAKVKESELKCPLHVSAGPAELNVILVSIDHLTLDACADDYDPPSGDPNRQPKPIPFTGTLKYHGEAFMQINTKQGKLGTVVAGALGMQSPDGSVAFPVAFDVPPQGEMRIVAGGQLEFTNQVARNPTTGLPYVTEPSMKMDGVSTDIYPPGDPLVAIFEPQDKECPK